MVKKLSPARPATVKTSRVKSEGVEKIAPSIQREVRPVAATGGDIFQMLADIKAELLRVEALIMPQIAERNTSRLILNKMDAIADVVARASGYTVGELLVAKRDARRARARFLAMAIQREMGTTDAEVAAYWQKDRSMARYAAIEIMHECQTNARFDAHVEAIRREISATLNTKQT
jgi:chromosomal replication initiation ATPase DnaA